MSNIPGWNRIPSGDPIFVEVNITGDGYYEVGGISEYDTDKYHSKPNFTGSLKKIARDMFTMWIKQDPSLRHRELFAWPLVVAFHPRTTVKFSDYTIPGSRNQKTDLDKFLADLAVEFDKLRVLLPFL